MLGPDYFLGAPVQNLPAGSDRAAWIVVARKKALEVFPKWIEAVKETYGEPAPCDAPSFPFGRSSSCDGRLGTEGTKYAAVGRCSAPRSTHAER